MQDSKVEKKFGYLYPVLFFIAYLQARAILPPHYSPTTGIIVWPLRLLVLFVGVKAYLKYKNSIPMLNGFIIYSVTSIVFIFISGKPIALYINSLAFYVTPMFLAYVGFSDFSNKFYRFFVYSCLALFVIGFYLHFIRPGWYQTAMLDLVTNAWSFDANPFHDDNWIIENARMGSFMLDSYAISYYSMFSLPIVLYSLSVDTNYRRLKIAAIVVIYAASMLCMQRASMICTTGTLLLYYYLRHKDQMLMTVVVSVILFFVVNFLVSRFGENDSFSMIIDRWTHMSFEDAMEGSRTRQINNIMRAWTNYPFGEGIGSGGGEARKMGLVGASDCNALKMLYEQGIVGFVIFYIFAIKSLIRSFKNIRYLFPEFIIIGCVLFAMIGADPLTYFFYILPFWYAIGRIWNNKYLLSLKKNNLHV